MTFRTAFLNWAAEEFPELATEFQGESAALRVHLAFGAFLRHTQEAIDRRQQERVVRYFQMADRVLANAYPKMRSLFHAGYVEHLRFDDDRAERSWAIQYLTPRLRKEFMASLGCPLELRETLARLVQ